MKFTLSLISFDVAALFARPLCENKAIQNVFLSLTIVFSLFVNGSSVDKINFISNFFCDFFGKSK